MEIRRLGKGDEERLREIRLRALEDAPSAFASTLDRERAFGPEVWAERVAGKDSAVFLAEDGGRPVGTATGFVSELPGTVHLVGMWVDPAARGSGAADHLIATVLEWARERGAREVELWVTVPNDRARALYTRHGFSPTGERQPLPSDPAVLEDRFTLALAAPETADSAER
ncbi:GNAT family N-acetyltransferase [Sphaerisporangium krabiense]|uniref:Ribosomal protein S18 acetylase RimI-like enzyme n=1 Tax=Sphaerisporangium krabiense TaxID=763782 RepID=A0A7W8ZCR9_9ACTN|nr:GNAT family N-acetyltransferase [Sphaerisporangium krabiense]MBB5631636.1 ribosomal protein S18 acetylase RimI-like enzyme [Sphaerisporangium krabiense]GII61052.1 GNAT family N-acetyltransferase [Sphaerisporangium krabiense]